LRAVVGRLFGACTFGDAFTAGVETFDREFIGGAVVAGDAEGAHSFGECAAQGDLFAIVAGVVDEVAESLELGAVGQLDDECMCNVFGVGGLSDNEGVAQQGIGLPFDVIVGLDFGDFGAYGADDVS